MCYATLPNAWSPRLHGLNAFRVSSFQFQVSISDLMGQRPLISPGSVKMFQDLNRRTHENHK